MSGYQTTIEDRLDVPDVTVYTKPSCVQCTATMRWLDQRRIPYTTLPLIEHHDVYEQARDSGITSAPVVRIVWPGGHSVMWGGFRPGHLSGMLDKHRRDSKGASLQA